VSCHERKESLTKSQYKTGLFIEAGIVLTHLLEAIVERVLVQRIFRAISLLLPC
jgi:hypothetical protein